MKSFRLRFRPEARLELEAAADWYEENSPGLGAEFVADAAALFIALGEFPDRFPTHRDAIRRAGMRRFPHYVYFTILPEGVEVLAVIHPSRNPAVIRKRLS
jgi:plasmid stabilization system protein ParE